jgi:hypothetical protein
MVKNIKGGSGSKSLSRKVVNSDNSKGSSVRKPESKLEFIAVVSKFFGNTAEITDIEGNKFRCFIRGKFRGRGKRNSIIATGKIILAGFREFESTDSKNTDLLTVYDNQEVQELLNIPALNINYLLLLNDNNSSNINNIDSNIEFTDTPDVEFTETNEINTKLVESEDPYNSISFDDI